MCKTATKVAKAAVKSHAAKKFATGLLYGLRGGNSDDYSVISESLKDVKIIEVAKSLSSLWSGFFAFKDEMKEVRIFVCE